MSYQEIATYKVSIAWNAGPILTDSGLVASPTVQSLMTNVWLFCGPLTIEQLAVFLETKAKERQLAWNMSSQVKQLVAQLRKSPQDYIAEPWPALAEGVNAGSAYGKDIVLDIHGNLLNGTFWFSPAKGIVLSTYLSIEKNIGYIWEA